MKSKQIALWVTIAAGLLALGWWMVFSKREQVRGDAIVIIVDGTPLTLDPIQMTEVMSASLGNACHAPLFRLAPDGSLLPELAESVSVSPSAMEASIILKAGCRFWDGTEVTAEDTAWSLLRLRDSQSPLKLTLERVSSCEAKDSRTVQVRFSRPEPDFAAQLAHLQAAILKKGSENNPEQPLARHLIGAGAFKPGRFEPGVRYEFNRNPGFPGESNVANLVFVVKSDPQSQLAACRAGEAQVLRLKGPALREALDFSNSEAVQPRPNLANYRVASQAANEINLAILNWESPKLKEIAQDKRGPMLRSLSARLNRQALSKALHGVIPIESVIPAAALSEKRQPTDKPINFEVSLTFPNLEMLCSNDPMSRELAGAAQPFLSEAGLATELRQLDPGRLMETVLGKNHDMVILTFEMPVVGVSPWLLFFTEGPFSAFGEVLADIRGAAEAARSVTAPLERANAWSIVAAKLDAEQTVWLPIASRRTYVLVHESVTDVRIDAAGTPYWSHIRVGEP